MMTSFSPYLPLNTKNQTFPLRPNNTTQSTKASFLSFQLNPCFKNTCFHSGISSNKWQKSSKPLFFSPETILLFVYSAVFLFLRLLFSVLPHDFPQKWQNLIVFSEEAEVQAKGYPSHLMKAIVAYEDRRFYRHSGIDPIGIARAVLLFPNGGGGSTITQQLVKNTFLKNERAFSRKAVEVLLALILERRLSKEKILSAYLRKIYWGHGVYGIESASKFYFGKCPSFLSLGECAMLAGIVPAPELRSPFNDPSRGKSSQARALRRMVDAGFLDIEAALLDVNQPLHLCGDRIEDQNVLPYSSSKRLGYSSIKYIWNWERESKIWELREDMERWAIRKRKKISSLCLLN